jgi:hypothetical protein
MKQTRQQYAPLSNLYYLDVYVHVAQGSQGKYNKYSHCHLVPSFAEKKTFFFQKENFIVETSAENIFNWPKLV